jgi:mRNA interferase HicA
VKRADLLRKISGAAAGKDVTFTLAREGGSHSVYRCGGQNVVIPRHREINEITARSIVRDLEDVLGKEWWK